MRAQALLFAVTTQCLGCGGSSAVEPKAVTIPPTIAAPATEPASSAPAAPLTRAQRRRAEELMAALGDAGDDEARQPLIQRMRSEVGGTGLVMALATVTTKSEEVRWRQTRAIFDAIRELADPDAADALAKWASADERDLHWRTEAAMALAEVGDLRAVALLAERMRHEPSALYDEDEAWQSDAGGHLSRTDRPRVIAARLLAELAAMHPTGRARLCREAEEPVTRWLSERSWPHANGLRFLATADCRAALPRLREMAFPTEPLPAVGAMPPFPEAFVTAQTAMRYVGRMRDAESVHDLIAQLGRKDPNLDITQQALMGAGLAMRGMALRALGYGAAQGLSSWGEPAAPGALAALTELVEDETWHEEAREAACHAMAWVDREAAGAVIDEVVRFGASPNPKHHFIAECYAATLAQRGIDQGVPALVHAMSGPVPDRARSSLALAIGRSGIEPATREVLRPLLDQSDVATAARLALLLGGERTDVEAALDGIAPDVNQGATGALADEYYRALGTFTVDDLERGHLARWVTNAAFAESAGHPWTRERLAAQLDNLVFDNGPHSLTRAVARFRLFTAARRGDADAARILEAMKERGALMALARHEDR